MTFSSCIESFFMKYNCVFSSILCTTNTTALGHARPCNVHRSLRTSALQRSGQLPIVSHTTVHTVSSDLFRYSTWTGFWWDRCTSATGVPSKHGQGCYLSTNWGYINIVNKHIPHKISYGSKINKARHDSITTVHQTLKWIYIMSQILSQLSCLK